MKILTSHPIAESSPDHIHPKGTATDNTVSPSFNWKIFSLVPGVRLLDLGCAGGGLVASIIRDGGFAAGVEGSDYSRKISRAEWATIPGNLFTADITYPFSLEDDDGDPVLFDVITAWEVLEHIQEDRIEAVMKNADRNLVPDGLFICSISRMNDCWQGYEYHATVQEKGWWTEKMAALGWRERPDVEEFIHPDWVRGPMHGMNSFPLVVSR